MTSVAVPGPRGQLRALVGLRWSMVRHPAVRIGLLLLLVALAALLVAASVSGPYAPPDTADEVSLLLPTALLAFAAMCIVAPLSAGGGFELLPAEHLVAFPVRSRTLFAASVTLTPLNLAWMLQVLALVAVVAWSFGRDAVPWPSYLVLAWYIAFTTVAGHALAWWVTAVRRTRGGRYGTWALVVAVVGLCLGILLAGRVTDVLDRTPTISVVAAMSGGQDGRWLEWGLRLAVLVTGAVVAWVLGARACAWALRRPGDLALVDPAARPVPRRAEARTLSGEVLAMDRASVWRSAPLRRGLLVLVILPAAVSFLAGMPWASVALLPPLVASGAALLFGVNAFCLDGSGALFLASSPVRPRTLLVSKARVVSEVVLAAVLAAVICAALRAGRPSLTDVLAVVGSVVACTALVVGICLRLSVRHPHRADLRGPRDTPAPPGTMALYSLRLAMTTTPVGLLFSMATYGDLWVVPLLLALAFLALALRSWLSTRRAWDDPVVRARVVTTVAAG